MKVNNAYLIAGASATALLIMAIAKLNSRKK